MKNPGFVVGLALVLMLAACSGNDGADPDGVLEAPTAEQEAPPPTEPETPPTAAPDEAPTPVPDAAPPPDEQAIAADPGDPQADVRFLSDDAQGGRDDGTAGSTNSRKYIVGQMAAFAEPMGEGDGGVAAYEQPFALGINVLGVIPGSDLADEYVVVGAHYDHLGTDCFSFDGSDDVCSGATDNATGVAAVLEIGRRLGTADAAPRRSVILAFWDSEEDGLLGSEYFVENPTVALTDMVGYVNFDILGANLSPTLRETTFVIGAETGGAELSTLVTEAIQEAGSPASQLSAIFGQGRSDYQNFINGGVPTVFLSDATGPCYHTAQDDFEIVDFDKLDVQIDVAFKLVSGLADTDEPPSFVSGTPVATFGDAVVLDSVNTLSLGDLDRFEVADQETLSQNRDAVAAIVAAGEVEFGDADVGALLGGTAQVIQLLTSGECDGFLS